MAHPLPYPPIIASCSASAELRPEHERDGLGQTSPLARLFRQLPATAGGELVKARAAVVVGHAPFRPQPSRGLESLQCRVERAVVDEQRALRRSLNGERDPVAVVRSKRQRAQDEEIECSLEER